jgi:hypothetical protein
MPPENIITNVDKRDVDPRYHEKLMSMNESQLADFYAKEKENSESDGDGMGGGGGGRVSAVRMRIRAERLMGHEFTQRLFNSKASIAEAQSFVRRLEDVFLAIDTAGTGYVTWNQFARVVLALAPPKLLRADVIAFMESQTEDDGALIDFREFVITGKVRKESQMDGLINDCCAAFTYARCNAFSYITAFGYL